MGADERIGDTKSPHLSPCNPPPRACVPRTSHRSLCIFPQSYVHHGHYIIRNYGFDCGAVEAAEVGAAEVSERGEREEWVNRA